MMPEIGSKNLLDLHIICLYDQKDFGAYVLIP